MKYTKQALIDEMKRSIKRNEEKIAEYSKPCDARKRRIRALERDSLRKRNEELKQKINKKELIERIECLKNIFGNKPEYVEIDTVIELISELDEPQPVKVPQVVADWYEENKDDFEGNLYRCIYNIPSTFDGAKLNEFERWFLNASTKPIQTLVNMHQFGYEVEEEKKYKITLLNRNDGDLYLVNQNADLANKYGHFSPVVLLFTKCTNFSEKCYKLTKKEVVAYDFGWVFDCPGIEIEEVEK